jgi:hypothetical protein
MTSITARNAQALTERNGTTLPKATPAPKTVAKGNKAVAPSKDQPETKAPAAPVAVACGCGCGQTANLGRQYRPGHDARHAGAVGRMVAEGKDGAQEALAALPAKLQAKAQAFADNRAKEAARKAAAAKVREDAKEALKAALAAI